MKSLKKVLIALSLSTLFFASNPYVTEPINTVPTSGPSNPIQGS
ncbi:hypothetical protein [Shouchella tritolerans]|nr:hypothetical protein [Shouchella tritolerans]